MLSSRNTKRMRGKKKKRLVETETQKETFKIFEEVRNFVDQSEY